MAKVKYYAKENTKLGTHSWYAVPVPNGTLTFYELCQEACENTSIEPSIMRAAVERLQAVNLKGRSLITTSNKNREDANDEAFSRFLQYLNRVN